MFEILYLLGKSARLGIKSYCPVKKQIFNRHNFFSKLSRHHFIEFNNNSKIHVTVQKCSRVREFNFFVPHWQPLTFLCVPYGQQYQLSQFALGFEIYILFVAVSILFEGLRWQQSECNKYEESPFGRKNCPKIYSLLKNRLQFYGKVPENGA